MQKFYTKTSKDEEQSVLLGIQNGEDIILEARISLRYGSNLCQLTYKGMRIIDYDPSLLRTSDFTGTPVLYPAPNRVEDGVFFFDGRKHEQVKRGKRVFEHGLVFDEPWTLINVQAADQNASLITRLDWSTDSPLFSAFPYLHSLSLKFEITENAISIAYDIFNQGSMGIPYGFGLHPYFQKLSGNHTEISVPVAKVMEADERLLPTGAVMPVEGTGLDLRKFTQVGAIDLDHVFLRESGSAPAVIRYPDQGLAVKITATDDFSHWVVYTPEGMPYFCLENQTCSTNAHNLFARGFEEISGLAVVEPGDHKGGKVEYRVIQEGL